MKRPLLSVIVIVVLSIGGLAASLIADYSPALGLDLQGGVAIVLEPSESVDTDILDQTIEILRSRVDALGVAEPEISRQGNTVVVQLPGVTDRQRARDIVGQTAELRFRPVLNVLPRDPAALEPDETAPDETAPDETVPDGTTETTVEEAETDETQTDETGSEGATETTGEGESSLGELQLIAQTDDATTTTDAESEPSTTTVADDAEPTPTTVADGEAPPDAADIDALITPREDDVFDQPVILPGREDDPFLYQLGPAELSGRVVDTADARFGVSSPGWTVQVEFTSSGAGEWDAMAARYVGQQVAIVLDGVVISAPTIQTAEFGGQAVISGDFDEGEAKNLALVLRFGALPVQLEELTVQEVSATLGKDALDAGVVAGLVGVALVALFVIAYYRLLGLVVVVSLSLAGALLWTIIAYLGENQGLALTLAGVTGIIVSIGVAVDSNIVYYERIKEEVRGGKSIRVSAAQAFDKSFSTIVKADVASLIGAGLLYLLTVGPVRGFALFLGISTVLDLVVSWFFMRPMAIMLAKSKRFGKPGLLGMPGAEPPPTAASPISGGVS